MFTDFLDSFWGGGRAGCLEVSSDVQLVVCMGECTQIFWIGFGGAVGQGVLRCRLVFNWWRVWGSVRISFGFVLGAADFFNVMMQRFYFVFAAALLHRIDLVT